MTFARFVLKLLTQGLLTTYHDWCELEARCKEESDGRYTNFEHLLTWRERAIQANKDLGHAKKMLGLYREYPAYLRFMFDCGQCHRAIKENRPPDMRINADWRNGQSDFYQVCAECKLDVPSGAAS